MGTYMNSMYQQYHLPDIKNMFLGRVYGTHTALDNYEATRWQWADNNVFICH